MKSYSYKVDEKEADSYAWARVEGVDASYKDLAQVCNRIRGKETFWALDFLEKAETGEIPVMYSSHSKRLGHRRELKGRKGRYPKKAAKIILKVLRSAIANGNVKGLAPETIIVHALANKKDTFPRLASKGLRVRSDFETSRVEIVLREKPGAKKEESKKEEKKPAEKPAAEKKEEPKKVEKPAEKKPEVKKPLEKSAEKPKEEKKEEPKKAPAVEKPKEAKSPEKKAPEKPAEKKPEQSKEAAKSESKPKEETKKVK